MVPLTQPNTSNHKSKPDGSLKTPFILYTNTKLGHEPPGKVNIWNYQVTPFSKPKLTQTVQSEYLLGESHVNNFNKRVNNYSKQTSQELLKQNVVIAKGVNSLGKKLSKWAPVEAGNLKNFDKTAQKKMVKFTDKKYPLASQLVSQHKLKH